MKPRMQNEPEYVNDYYQKMAQNERDYIRERIL